FFSPSVPLLHLHSFPTRRSSDLSHGLTDSGTLSLRFSSHRFGVPWFHVSDTVFLVLEVVSLAGPHGTFMKVTRGVPTQQWRGLHITGGHHFGGEHLLVRGVHQSTDQGQRDTTSQTDERQQIIDNTDDLEETHSVPIGRAGCCASSTTSTRCAATGRLVALVEILT